MDRAQPQENDRFSSKLDWEHVSDLAATLPKIHEYIVKRVVNEREYSKQLSMFYDSVKSLLAQAMGVNPDQIQLSFDLSDEDYPYTNRENENRDDEIDTIHLVNLTSIDLLKELDARDPIKAGKLREKQSLLKSKQSQWIGKVIVRSLGTLAHEIYHIRQHQIPSYREDTSASNLFSGILSDKFYQDDLGERSAEAIAIRFYREIDKNLQPGILKTILHREIETVMNKLKDRSQTPWLSPTFRGRRA